LIGEKLNSDQISLATAHCFVTMATVPGYASNASGIQNNNNQNAANNSNTNHRRRTRENSAASKRKRQHFDLMDVDFPNKYSAPFHFEPPLSDWMLTASLASFRKEVEQMQAERDKRVEEIIRKVYEEQDKKLEHMIRMVCDVQDKKMVSIFNEIVSLKDRIRDLEEESHRSKKRRRN